MTPSELRAVYRRHLEAHGETVSLVRGFGGVAPTTVANLLARVMGYSPEELVGGIAEGERKVILLAEDLAATAIPTPARNDRVVWNGKTLNVVAVDDATRRVAGETIAFELRVAGG